MVNEKIFSCLVSYVNRVSTTVQYKSWSDDFCRNEVKTCTNDLLSILRKLIDFSNLSQTEARMLHFIKFDDKSDLYLIPLYLLPIIPIGTELICIDGTTITYNGSNIDDDIRYGCIAYGILIPEDNKKNNDATFCSGDCPHCFEVADPTTCELGKENDN